MPKKRINTTKVVAVAIPTIFFAIMAYIVVTTGENAWSGIANLFLWWFLLHGSLAAIGAVSARGHPLSIGVAFIAAPFTSFQPFFRSGWLAGIVEAKFRMPVVKDFQALSKIETMKEFFRNKVIHLLMVVALTNLGSIIATITFFAASPWLVHIHLFG